MTHPYRERSASPEVEPSPGDLRLIFPSLPEGTPPPVTTGHVQQYQRPWRGGGWKTIETQHLSMIVHHVEKVPAESREVTAMLLRAFPKQLNGEDTLKIKIAFVSKPDSHTAYATWWYKGVQQTSLLWWGDSPVLGQFPEFDVIFRQKVRF